MAGQLYIKLLVAIVHNLRVLLIFFDFVLFVFWRWDPLQKMLFCMRKFPVHVVISILQAFNCRFLRFLYMTLFFFFISKPRPNGMRACLILIQETLLIVFYLR